MRKFKFYFIFKIKQRVPSVYIKLEKPQKSEYEPFAILCLKI